MPYCCGWLFGNFVDKEPVVFHVLTRCTSPGFHRKLLSLSWQKSCRELNGMLTWAFQFMIIEWCVSTIKYQIVQQSQSPSKWIHRHKGDPSRWFSIISYKALKICQRKVLCQHKLTGTAPNQLARSHVDYSTKNKHIIVCYIYIYTSLFIKEQTLTQDSKFKKIVRTAPPALA